MISFDEFQKQVKFREYQRKQPESIAAQNHNAAIQMHKDSGLPYRICLDLIKSASRDMPGVWYPLCDFITYGEYKGQDYEMPDELRTAPFPRTTDELDTITYCILHQRGNEETLREQYKIVLDRERGYSLFDDKGAYYYAHFLSGYDISVFTVFNLYGEVFHDAEETNAYMNLLETLQGRFESKPRSYYKPKIK